MRNIFLSIAITFICSSSLQAQEERWTDKFELDGFSAISFVEEIHPLDDVWHIGDTFANFRPLIRYNMNKKVRLVSEIEFAWIEAERNWLQETWIGYKLGDSWEVSLGRVSTSMIYITPPPRANPTVIYPRFFRGIHNTGLKLRGSDGPWEFVIDVGGNSSVYFAHEDAFSHIETSFRVKRNIGKNSFIAVNSQLGDGVQRVAGDFTTDIGQLHLGCAGMYSSEDRVEQCSAWSYVSYSLTDDLQPHVLYDYLEGSGSSILFGARYNIWRRLDATAGYQVAIDEEAPKGLSLRLRWRF